MLFVAGTLYSYFFATCPYFVPRSSIKTCFQVNKWSSFCVSALSVFCFIVNIMALDASPFSESTLGSGNYDSITYFNFLSKIISYTLVATLSNVVPLQLRHSLRLPFLYNDIITPSSQSCVTFPSSQTSRIFCLSFPLLFMVKVFCSFLVVHFLDNLQYLAYTNFFVGFRFHISIPFWCYGK